METHVEEALNSTLETYRATLIAIGNAGVRACPTNWVQKTRLGGAPASLRKQFYRT